ncbi:MAG: hypothetical protein U5K37_10775 [Natrialbaceae archaeon]|nr:hypothetical protein [Natrialbaceae archaeon]
MPPVEGELADSLQRAFGGGAGEAATVARAAQDLADSGQYRTDTGTTLSPNFLLEELAQAPDGTPADRWNWWIGSLEVAYGGYTDFAVRRFPE